MAKCSSFAKICSINAVTPEFIKYEEAIRKLNSLQSNASVLQEIRTRSDSANNRIHNVVRTMKYLERVGVDIDSLNDKVIHVSGTKGKGSTAMLTESLLRSVPYKTGLFVSPHLTNVRERISINGSPLTLTKFVEYFWDVYNTLYQQKDDEHDMPSYFKFLTVMAFKVFLSEDVDVAIVEVGIGGELDCTNVFRSTPIVGITSIGLDHVSILGNTEEKISWQKAGIFKPGCRAFTIPGHKPSVLEVLQSRAVERKCHLEVVPHFSDYSWSYSDFSFPQKLNASLALQLAKAWDIWKNNLEHRDYDKFSVSEREQKAIRECRIPGRCHVIRSKVADVTYYLDGAHTTESLIVAKNWFKENCTRSSKKLLIFNMTGNRKVLSLLELLKECQFSEAIFCTNNVSNTTEDLPADFVKACDNIDDSFTKAKENLKTWMSICPETPGRAVPTVAEALSLAQSDCPTNVLITGSFHLVGAAFSLLQPGENGG